VHQDFFELGGHSLLAMRLLTRLKGLIGADANLREFFGNPTIEGLARTLKHAFESPGAATDSIARTPSLPPKISRSPRVAVVRNSKKALE
jgi:hypothetical protein